MKSLSTKTQILILTLALVSLSLGFFIVLTVFQINDQLHDDMERRAISLISVLAINVGPRIEIEDTAYLNDIVIGAFEDEDIIGICICGEDDKEIFFHSKVDYLDDLDVYCPAIDTLIINHINDMVIVSKPIKYEGEFVGDIWLAISEISVASRVKSSIAYLLGLSILVLLAVFAAGNLIASRIVKPIKIFENAAKRIQDGGRECSIDISPLNKDFIPLGLAFNKMSLGLECAFDELKASHQNLEAQVEIRTSELQKELSERKKVEEQKRQRLERGQNQRIAISRLISDERVINGNFDSAIESIVEIVAEALNVERVSIWMFDEENTQMQCIDLFEVSNLKHSQGTVLKISDFPKYFAAINNERILACNNAQTDPRTSEFTESYLVPLEISSMLDTSFQVSGKLLGVICAEHTGEPREWKDDEIAFIDEISGQLAQVYSNTERKRSEKVRSALFKISEASNASKSVEELLKIIHITLETFIDASNFYVALYNPDTKLYTFPYCVDEYEDIDFSPAELRKSLTDYVRRTGESLLVDERYHDKLVQRNEVELVGTPSPIWLGVPLKTAQGVIGVAVVQNYHDANVYSLDDLQLLSSMSNYLAMAIDRKQMINQKLSLQDELERAQRMESLGILAGGVAHDLNNMLGPLVGYPELILMKLPKDSPIRKQVQRIGRSAKDAADVIQDLLTLARRGRYEMEPTNLVEVIESYLDSPSYRKLSEERPEIKLNCDFKDRYLFINGSSPHLSKVVMNLIVNASDAIPASGTLNISVSQKSIDKLFGGYEKVEPGEYVILRVRDSGTGINPEDLDKIFEPYFSKKIMGSSGSGLGLSVVYGIVKDHHGYYDIFSTRGKGTEFVLYFKAIEKPMETIINTRDEIGGQETILIVDDAPEQRDIASEFLTNLGYKVATVDNGHKAIDHLSKNKADLVIMDMIMEKDFDGLETYREILKIHPGQKAVVVSGFSATERVDEMLSLGAGSYVKKPFTFGVLSKAIREELDRKSHIKTPVT